MNTERDLEICRLYLKGKTQKECAKQFGLSQERIGQILRKAGFSVKDKVSGRDKHLGITVSASTKEGLKKKASQHGVSVSKFASTVLDAVVKSE